VGRDQVRIRPPGPRAPPPGDFGGITNINGCHTYSTKYFVSPIQ
jgi:hypothetical protein